MTNNTDIFKPIQQSVFGAIGNLIPLRPHGNSPETNSRQLLVLCYHNIVEESHNEGMADDYFFLNLPVNMLEKQIRWVLQNFDIISLDDWISDRNLPEKAAIITFDDGYKSVYSLAFSVLENLKVTATIFLTGAHVHERQLPWIARLHYIFDNIFLQRIINSQKKTFTSLRPKIFKLLIGIKSFLKKKRIEDIDCFLKMLENSFQCFLPQDIIKRKFLSNNEINQLTSHGWTIGNHTYNHVNLNYLSDQDVKDEIVLTRGALENFKQYRDILGIPFGDLHSYSDNVINLAHKNGISHIFTTRGGVNVLHPQDTLVDRVICETYSFNYFKFLASGKKRNIEDILKNFLQH